MEYNIIINSSTLSDDKIGINARVIRTADNVEVGKFLHIAEGQNAAEAFIAAISANLAAHPSFKPNEHF